MRVRRGGGGGGGGRGQEGAAEVHTSITKEAYSFVIFQIGGSPNSTPPPPISGSVHGYCVTENC